MINQKPSKYNPTIEASYKRQKTKKPTQQKSKKTETYEIMTPQLVGVKTT